MLEGPCRFDRDTHTYTIGPWEVPGTGDIMEVGGILDTRWFDLAGRERGSAVHTATYLMDLEQLRLPQVQGDARGWMIAYQAFLKKHKPVYRLLEQCVYERELGFATILDRAGFTIYNDAGRRIRGPFVLNIKTGGSTDAHPVQRAGEVMAWRHRDLAVDRYTLYLRKRGTFSLLPHIYAGDFDAFEDCLATWRKECHNPRRHGPKTLLKRLPSRRRLTTFRQQLLASAGTSSARSRVSIPSRTSSGSRALSLKTMPSTSSSPSRSTASRNTVAPSTGSTSRPTKSARGRRRRGR